MEWRKGWNSTSLIGYLICAFIGAFILCFYWWFAGKMFTANNKQQSSALQLKQPTAEEIAAEVAKKIPGLIPESMKSETATFREKVEKVVVSLGGVNTPISISALQHRLAEPYNFGGYKPIRVYFEKEKLFVDVSIYGGPGQAPIEVKHNDFIIRVPGYDRNFDLTTLEVVNKNLSPVFQLIYRTPYQIIINGIFPSPAGLMLANEDGLRTNVPTIPESFRIVRLFKYPSNQFPGQREEMRRVIPGPDLKRRALNLSAELTYFVGEQEKIFRDATQRGETSKMIKIASLTASLYDDKIALKCSGIAEEIAATGINVGRLPSHCRSAINFIGMREVAEQMRTLAERLP